MILLDTNVVSEPLRHAPAAKVGDWIDAQLLETLYLYAITVAEQRAGVALLPSGKRRTGLTWKSAYSLCSPGVYYRSTLPAPKLMRS